MLACVEKKLSKRKFPKPSGGEAALHVEMKFFSK